MTDILGPANAPNFTTTRPADDRTIGATDTWMKDCTAPGNNDGTKIKAAQFNSMIGNMRALVRGNGNTGAGPAVVTEDNADDMILRGVLHLIQRGQQTYAVAAGTTNALTVSLTPPLAEYKAGEVLTVKISATNTGAATLNVNGLGVKSILRGDGAPLQAGDLVAGQLASIQYDGTAWQVDGLKTSQQPPRNLQAYSTAGTYTFTVPTGVYKVFARVVGGGGGAAGVGTHPDLSLRPQGAGGAGGAAEGWVSVSPGQNITVTVGAGGAGGAKSPLTANANGGSGGTGGTSSFGAFMSATGGGGGVNMSGGLGGDGSGGQITFVGGMGGDAFSVASDAIKIGGLGGASLLGGGGRASTLYLSNVVNGKAPGSGGGSVYTERDAGENGGGWGGTGKDGIVIVQW